jgi:thiamine pyrophosphate-dependent acetolactate synthase large subunit-like protein
MKCTLFRKFESEKDIVLQGANQTGWRANGIPEIFGNVEWDVQTDLKMFMRAYIDRMTPDFVNLSIGLRVPQLYEETKQLIMKVPQAFLVCFTGQVPIHLIGNDTFQEVDFVGITRSICKYAVMVRKRENLAETIKKAFYIAKTGKPGVVVVDLPKDVQRAYGSDFYPKEISTGTRFNERITGKTEEFAVNAKIIHIGENDQMLTSGGLETMGYGFPAAIGAKLGNPHKDVIVISGDGGMQMNIQEMATAVVYELPVIICVLNNGYLGNLRRWQEMFYERRYSSTCMRYRRSCEIVRGGNVMILCIKFVEGG